MSFLTIGIMWVNHHGMFDRIAFTDRGLLFLNLGLLAGIAFLPFPTALLAAIHPRQRQCCDRGGRLRHDDGGHRVVLHRAPRVSPPPSEPVEAGVTAEGVRRAGRLTALGPTAYLVATLVAIVAPYVALALFGGIAVFFAIGSRTTDPG